MTDRAKLVIICALEREVSGLVKGWETGAVDVAGGAFSAKYRRQGDCVVIAAGTGWERARLATKVAVETFHPELVTSVGYSGSLSSALTVGSLFVPTQVVGFTNGRVYSTGIGQGVLVTAGSVVGASEKASLAKRYGAQAVDMEAAAVAEVAHASGIRFAAVKAISDDVHDRIDFVSDFVAPEGFKTGAFLLHIAVRPQLWGAVAKLGKNSKSAAETLASALQELVASPEGFLQKNALPSTAQQGSLN